MNKNKNWTHWIPAILILCIVGGFYAGKTYTRKHLFIEGKNKIDNILEIINQQYVDTVNMGLLIEKTAKNLISELDPHSYLIPAEDLQIVVDELEGSFGGIGVTFNMPSDTILVINVISGGPAEKAGILPFDRIITINDSVYAGKNISQNKIMRTLRGPESSRVKLGIQRGSLPELIYFDVTRGDVPNYTIEISYKLKENIGYIKLKNFGRTTYNEFITAIAKLKKEGCNGYVIDLRGNNGGYLDAAIRVCNEFLTGRKSILYTEGKAFGRQNFFADGTGSCQNAPLVILTDELSGSASEIFAGAIQDNDRGLIIGRRSFGKGLVQAPIPLKDGSELRLTVARYYTPSGRCIQKTYELGKQEEYDRDLYNRFMHGEFDSADSIKTDNLPVYHTVGGRIVYGGGGIMPDIFIPMDTNNVTSYYANVLNSNVLYQFTLEYSEKNHTKLAAFPSYDKLYAYLQQQPLLNEFTDYAETKGIKRRPTLIQISKNLIENSLYAYIIRNFFNYDGFYRVTQKDDAPLLRAIQVIDDGTWQPVISPQNVS